uniref:Uncharacterized protein n=1 Tax=Strigops habroptila TaxID=2489341 RepID=A0A672U4T6_STRHB
MSKANGVPVFRGVPRSRRCRVRPCPLSARGWESGRYRPAAPTARKGSAPLTAPLNEPVGNGEPVAVLKRLFGCRAGQQTSVGSLTGSLVLFEGAHLQTGKCGGSACRLVSIKPCLSAPACMLSL